MPPAEAPLASASVSPAPVSVLTAGQPVVPASEAPEAVIDQGSHLAQILEGRPSVHGSLYHHQAVDQVGQGLTVTARTADNVVEAVELAGVDFGLAVQWHPEQTLEDLSLFTALIEAAQKHRSTK